jgi:hypothetical protein
LFSNDIWRKQVIINPFGRYEGNVKGSDIREGYGVMKYSLNGFTYIPSPVINSYSPTTAGKGVSVLIKGLNLSSVNAVSF